MARRKPEGRFTVVGPLVEPRPAVEVDHGLSIAANYATARMELEGEYRYDVKDLMGNVLASAIKLEGEKAVETIRY